MKRKLLIIVSLLLFPAIIFAWLLFGSATTFSSASKYIYVRGGQSASQQVISQFNTGNLIRTSSLFNITASQLKVWQRVKPGRFEIKKGESIFDIVRMFRNNQQSPVKLVINKLRIKEDIAKAIGKNFSTDSLTALLFLNNSDSLIKIGTDTNSLLTTIIPNTYFFNWNTSTKNILLRLKNEEDKFWNENNRIQKAQALGFTPKQVYILASIVEEETNKNGEKGNVASVYINRLNKGMPLAADPSIKFALKDFTLKRVLYNHLTVASPYNTYKNKGLPPGPICTPSIKTIDAVLNAPATDYLFFVAKSDFSGYHHFSNNYAEHQQYAKAYQTALNELIAKKANKNSTLR